MGDTSDVAAKPEGSERARTRGQARVGYLGPPGTFSQQAAREYAPAAHHVALGDIAGVVAAAETGAVEEAIVPLENSTEGAVTVTTDLLVHRTELKIRREVVVPIHHCLLTEPDVALEDVEVVYSHPQAIAQCRGYLEHHLPGAEAVASLSTVSAVHDMQAAGRASAAISSRRAAEVLGASVRASGIEDIPGNRTRFVVLGREDHQPTERDKTSICFDFSADGPGTLHGVLSELADRRINMHKIESRPAKSSLGQYVFLIDMEGHREDPVVAEALESIRARASSFKILGSYPQASDPAP
ncbi:prephenate dehydratase [Candidatus Palauibacter sp.]|uniref:prephenate dehydratase n=1 Tax=Candidatus Palauibacter sp. TaxID=3101350 RepID=UPI003B523662